MEKSRNIWCLIICQLLAAVSVHAQYTDLHLERLAHYPFTLQAEDISGFSNNGIVYGAVKEVGYLGEADEAYYFDGTDDFIDCGDRLTGISSRLTVTCWIRSDTVTDNCHIVSKYAYLSDAGFILGMEDGHAKWASRIGTGQFIRMTSDVRIDDGAWHHLAGMVEGPVWSLYLDGNLVNQVNTGTDSPDLSNSAHLTIGAYQKEEGEVGDHFRGRIDNVIIYGRTLNDCELEFLYTGAPYGPR